MKSVWVLTFLNGEVSLFTSKKKLVDYVKTEYYNLLQDEEKETFYDSKDEEFCFYYRSKVF